MVPGLATATPPWDILVAGGGDDIVVKPLLVVVIPLLVLIPSDPMLKTDEGNEKIGEG